MSTTTSLSEFTDAPSTSAQSSALKPAAPLATGPDSYTPTQLEDTLLAAGSYAMTNLYSQTACPSAPGVVCRTTNSSLSRAEEMARTAQHRQRDVRDRLIDRSPEDSQVAKNDGTLLPTTDEGCTSSTLKGFQMSSCPPQFGAGGQVSSDPAYNAVTFY
jgi:hypothetical protein